jgi:chromate transporter
VIIARIQSTTLDYSSVLAYVGREVIARFGLTTGDVVAGLGLAETTPGPLILVVEFLAFVAGYRDPGSLPPALAGSLTAAVTLWATFVPSFVWVLTGAPWIERLRSVARLTGALAAVTAAVVGVIAGLALSVATASLFEESVVVEPFLQPIAVPKLATVEPLHLAIAIGSFVAIRRFRVHVVWIVLAAAAAGLLGSLVR